MSDSNTYTVWIGGIPDLERATKQEAEKVYAYWVDKGYDDVVIEKDKYDPNHWDNSCQTLRRLA